MQKSIGFTGQIIIISINDSYFGREGHFDEGVRVFVSNGWLGKGLVVIKIR